MAEPPLHANHAAMPSVMRMDVSPMNSAAYCHTSIDSRSFQDRRTTESRYDKLR
jgi:hypothetical protein